jgi:PmbA protein
MVWRTIIQDAGSGVIKMNILEYTKRGLEKTGAQDFIIGMNQSESAQVKFANSEIVTNKNWISTNISVFVAINKRIIGTNLKDPTQDSADEAMKKVVKLSKMVEPNKDYRGIAKGPFSYKKIGGLFDKKAIDVNADELVEKAVNKGLENGVKRVAGVLEKSVSRSALLTSGDVEASEESTHLYLSLRALAEKDASGHGVCVSRNLKDFDVGKTAEQAANIAKRAANPKHGRPGRYDILFKPLPFANLLTRVGSSASIFNVEAGLSFLGDKINKKVASNEFDLIDDATMPKGFGSTPFDAEGVPTQRNVIIENGILKTYLHNTSTAQRYKTKTTANAGLISPEPINLYLKEGNISEDELLGQVKHGLVVTNTWYTRFQNFATGDFSTIPRDGIFLIKNGKIAGAVKDIRISDNMINIIKNVVGIGKHIYQVMGWEVELPVTLAPVLVKNVKITRSTE